MADQNNAQTPPGTITGVNTGGGKVPGATIADAGITNVGAETVELERLKLMIEAWKKTVDVQQHFNDIQIRIRNFAITVLTAVLAAAGVATQQHTSVTFAIPLVGETIHTLLAVWILGAGVIALMAVYITELGYHQLLKGAVEHADSIQNRLEKIEPLVSMSIALGDTIGRNSAIYFFGGKVRSTTRVNLFYLVILVLLIILMTALQLSYKEG
jgi:hypothetical protein